MKFHQPLQMEVEALDDFIKTMWGLFKALYYKIRGKNKDGE